MMSAKHLLTETEADTSAGMVRDRAPTAAAAVSAVSSQALEVENRAVTQKKSYFFVRWKGEDDV